MALLVQDKISTKRAAVLGYLTNQLLRTLSAIDHELNPDDDEATVIVVHTDRSCTGHPDMETLGQSQAAKNDEPANRTVTQMPAGPTKNEECAKSAETVSSLADWSRLRT